LVLVDVMNALYATRKIFTGTSPEDEVVALSKMLGLKVAREAEVLLFVDTERLSEQDWNNLQAAVFGRGVEVVHVPNAYGCDMVDDAIFATLYREHEKRESHVPFVVITADGDFVPAIRDIRDSGRQMIVGLPPNIHKPRVAYAGHSYEWLDLVNHYENLALYLSLAPWLSEHEKEFLEGRHGELDRFQVMHDLAREVLRSMPRDVVPHEDEVTVGTKLACAAGFSIPPVTAMYLVQALRFYGVITRVPGPIYSVNPSHPAFLRLK
jgi:hypothetical protein